MKPVNQKILLPELGDCFRACVASIFEFAIEDMPNFWEQTQDGREYWELTNDWTAKNLGCRCVTATFLNGMDYQIKGVLCVALGASERGSEDHAVVWRDGMIHDPHPSKFGLTNIPDAFTFFVPLTPTYDWPVERSNKDIEND